ncbi:YggL 50S ribosome-binding family protein [Hymenobacter ruber]
MKKRLRKKLRLREFQEMGFSVKFDLAELGSDEAYFTFWDKLVEVVEANHLLMGGGLNDFFVGTDSRRSATEADRKAIETWLHQQPEVSAVNVSLLVDAWHGSFE